MYCQSKEKFSNPKPSFEDAPPKIVEKMVRVFSGARIEAKQKMETPPNHVTMYAGKISHIAARPSAQPNLMSLSRFALRSMCRFWNRTTCGSVDQYTISAGYTIKGLRMPAMTNPQSEIEKVASTAVVADTLLS